MRIKNEDEKSSWFNWKYKLHLKYGWKKNISQEFRLKNIFETRNYFTEEVEKNELMSQKHKKVCTILNYIENRE